MRRDRSRAKNTSDLAEGMDGLLMSVLAISRSLRALASDAGLTPTELAILVRLDQHSEQRAADVAAAAALHRTLVSRVLAGMEDKGLISRAADQADRRASRLTITRAGHELLADIRARQAEWLADRIGRLPTDDVSRLLAAVPALAALAEANEAASGQ